MPSPGNRTYREIVSQPEAWAAALEAVRAEAGALRAFYRAGGYDAVLVTGCGSTHYAALAVAARMQELAGIPARGLPASELWLHPCPAYGAYRRPLLVAISRSGETTETVRAVERFRAEGRSDVLTLSCYPGAALAALGAVNLVFPAAQEESVAQTRAFTTLFLAGAALAALWGGRDDLLEAMAGLPAAGRRVLAEHGALAASLGRDPGLERFYFLGSGPRYGLACELSLKMKEMSLSHSEPFHVMEFRHGPQSMVTSQTLIVGLLSSANGAPERAVLSEMRARGAHVLALGEDAADVAFASGIGEAARDVLYLPVGQLLAYERALSRGLDPDRPHNLDAVVKLDG